MNAFVAKNVIAQATKAEEESARKQAYESPSVSASSGSAVDLSVMTPTTVGQMPIPMTHRQESLAGSEGMAISPTSSIPTLGGLNFIQQPSSESILTQAAFFVNAPSTANPSTKQHPESVFQNPPPVINGAFFGNTLPAPSSVFSHTFGESTLASLLTAAPLMNPSVTNLASLSSMAVDPSTNQETPPVEESNASGNAANSAPVLPNSEVPPLNTKPSLEYPPFKKQKSQTDGPEGLEDESDWGPIENSLLSQAVEECGQNWNLVATKFPGKTASYCEYQWARIQPKKGKWSEEEDQRLTSAYRCMYDLETGLNNGQPPNTTQTIFWFKVAGWIPGRSGAQCVARYSEALDPAVK